MDGFCFSVLRSCRTLEKLDRRTGQRRDATRAPIQARNGWRPSGRLLVTPPHHLSDGQILSNLWGPPHHASVRFFDGVPNSLRNARYCDDAEFAKMRPHDRDSNWRVGQQAVQQNVRSNRLGLWCRAGPRRRLSLKDSWQPLYQFRASETVIAALTTPSRSRIEESRIT
jgi:hypothetical protein